MADRALEGAGVLVTRPRRRSAELVSAIEARGGRAVLFPVIEIVPRSPGDVRDDIAQLSEADITVFISANAVEHGLEYAAGAIAAIGPATAAAIESAARIVDIRPAAGYASEHLLDEPALKDVAGRTVRIVRGDAGRELLATTLRERGANVEYLSVYERRMPDCPDEAVAALESEWRRGDIGVVVVMSVQSLDNLLAMLPDSCRDLLAATPLVTPSARVLKESLERLPGAGVVLAAGPRAGDVVDTIVTTVRPGLDPPERNS